VGFKLILLRFLMRFFLVNFLLLCSGGVLSQQLSVESENRILLNSNPWFTLGDTCVRANYTQFCQSDGTLKIGKQTTFQGTDGWGKFTATRTVWSPVSFETVTRQYKVEGTIVFQQIFPEGLEGTSAGSVDQLVSMFPSIKIEDTNSSEPRGYVQWQGAMTGAGVHIGQWDAKSSGLGSGLENTGTLAVFTTKETVVMSCASEFMSCNQLVTSDHELGWGVMGGVTSIPAGFSMEIVFSAGNGIQNSMDAWGNKLLNRYGKKREIANSDFTTNYLAYSTDNGAYYYYLTEDGKNYEETMVDIKAYADKEGIPYRHWLMDSWWYFKGTGGGVKNWTAMPSIFPHGADYVYNKTEWPVVAHNRYWSANTDYAKQNGGKWDFIIEPDSHNGLAFPLQQEFWDWLLADARKWGLKTYEQDWLYNEFSEMNCTTSSATLARQWLMQMGTAAQRNGVTIQYCMSWVRHILQSVEIQAVTQARASGDYHPGKDQWDIGLTSMLAHALAITPTKDNFWSTPTEQGRYGKDTEPFNRLQSAVSSFSTGPVAPSDKIGGSDVSLIMKSCAADGLLLQPDRPAMLIDTAIHAAATIGKGPVGKVWSTETVLTGARFLYLLAINSNEYTMTVEELSGTSDTFMAWEANNTAPQKFDPAHPISLPNTDKYTFNVWTAAPVLSNGWTFMGEAQTKWVAVSNDRFSDLAVTDASVSVVVTGHPGEKVEIMFVAPGDTTAITVTCTVTESTKVVASVPDQSCTPL